MGYTVYYKINPKVSKKTYNAALEKVKLMIYKYAQDNRGTNNSLSGYSAFSTKYDGIKFNGARDEACEDFCLPSYDNLAAFCSHFNFTKTNRRAYSPAVIAACLLLRKELKKKFEFSTDDGPVEKDQFYEQGISILMQYHRWAEKEKTKKSEQSAENPE